MKLQGIFVAAATPFDFSGEIYKVKVEHNIVKWNLTSVSGYALGGTAGEGPLLGEDEKAGLWEVAAKHAAPEKMLLADCSAEGVEISARLAKRAASLGFHAIVCATPHEYKSLMYARESQMLYFRSVADRSPIPVIIENAPGYTGVDVLPETTAALAAHPNIAGVIENGTPPERIAQIKEQAEPGFQILAGSCTRLLESLEQGATGGLLALASATPYACITLWEAFRMREQAAALDWQERITQPGIAVTDVFGVPGLKYAMELNGYYGGPPRLPFCPPNQAARGEIEGIFQGLRG
jgi:4-hydroxy-2-oxoglutarate aldolase